MYLVKTNTKDQLIDSLDKIYRNFLDLDKHPIKEMQDEKLNKLRITCKNECFYTHPKEIVHIGDSIVCRECKSACLECGSTDKFTSNYCEKCYTTIFVSSPNIKKCKFCNELYSDICECWKARNELGRREIKDVILSILKLNTSKLENKNYKMKFSSIYSKPRVKFTLNVTIENNQVKEYKIIDVNFELPEHQYVEVPDAEIKACANIEYLESNLNDYVTLDNLTNIAS